MPFFFFFTNFSHIKECIKKSPERKPAFQMALVARPLSADLSQLMAFVLRR